MNNSYNYQNDNNMQWNGNSNSPKNMRKNEYNNSYNMSSMNNNNNSQVSNWNFYFHLNKY